MLDAETISGTIMLKRLPHFDPSCSNKKVICILNLIVLKDESHLNVILPWSLPSTRNLLPLLFRHNAQFFCITIVLKIMLA